MFGFHPFQQSHLCFQWSLWKKPVSFSIMINNLKVFTMANYKREGNLRCLTWRKKNRSHFEIIASMLEAMKDNAASRYSLMKHMGSNFTEIKKYVQSLTEMGFIEMDIKKRHVLYRASEKGLDFLRQYYILLGMTLSTRAYENIALPKLVKVREF